MLNGRPYPLRLVLDQGYWPADLLTAPDDDALRRDVELAKAMGFNGVRKHQKIEDPALPLLGRPARPAGLGRDAERLPLHAHSDPANGARVDRGDRARRSHPCLIVWVPFNESWGVPNLADSARERDATCRRSTT
jgi:hypothetical protein